VALRLVPDLGPIKTSIDPLFLDEGLWHSWTVNMESAKLDAWTTFILAGKTIGIISQSALKERYSGR